MSPGFVEICRPANEAELAMIRARLDATGIRYYVNNEFAGLRAGGIGQIIVLAESERAQEAAEIVGEVLN